MKLTFDPMTIQHLGFRMYSQLPNALAELVANSYDADACEVKVIVSGGTAPSVKVIDDGHGMSEDELQNRYLRIGRNRVLAGEKLSESGRRRAAGRKGLGKLAPFGIGTEVIVRTKRLNSSAWTVVTLDWDVMLNSHGEYEPGVSREPGDPRERGTSVEVRKLKRSSRIDAESLALSLARLFNYSDDGFRLQVVPPEGEPIDVNRDRRYQSISTESTWRVPDEAPVNDPHGISPRISGMILAASRPLPSQMRGITLYINGRLANDPEFYGASESSYASAYLTGHIEADYLDDLPEDIVATDRRSISWDTAEPAALQAYIQATLRKVSQLWRETRRDAQQRRLKTELNVDPSAWADTIRGPESQAVSEVLGVLISPDSQIGDEDRSRVVSGLRTIAPEYADLHWRHIHPEIQASCELEYQGGHYYAALAEAIKSYVHAVESSIHGDARELNALEAAFGGKQPRIDVASPWASVNLGRDTRANIRKAQHELSRATWLGFRNPIQHEERRVLENHGIFTYQDCLDAISIISHLRRRLDGSSAQTSLPAPTPDTADAEH